MSPTWVIAVALSALLSILLCISPLILQVQLRNTAISVLIASVLISNLLNFLNALIWPTEDPTGLWQGQVLCDIEIKLRIGLDMTICGALTCVFRQLSSIVHPDHHALQPSRSQIRNTIIFEIIFCVILPTLRMMLSYVVQPDRYWILGIYGCAPSVDTSWPSYALVLVWPFAVCLQSVWYGGLVLFRLAKRSRELSKLLPMGQAPGNERRTKKLFMMTLVLFCLNTPTRTYVFFVKLNKLSSLEPYSWSRVHPQDWAQRIIMIPFKPSVIPGYATNTASAIVVFFFLASGPEAVAMYKVWLAQMSSWVQWPRKWKHRSAPKTSQVASRGSIYRPDRNSAHELEANWGFGRTRNAGVSRFGRYGLRRE